MADQTFPNMETKKELELEEIFGFEEARRTAEELRRKGLLEQNYVEPLFFPNRVFINNIDCYHGKNIAKVGLLTKQVLRFCGKRLARHVSIIHKKILHFLLLCPTLTSTTFSR